ncbi:MAG TPA: SGNH/GDSL hydrolase family protein [Mucilaginibacter sp.]
MYAQNPSCSAAAQFYSKDSINVTTFGASTVAGVGGFSFQGYLKQDLGVCYKGKVFTVTTNGVFGETTTQGLVRFPAAITGRTGFVLILMGADDALALARGAMKISETTSNMRYYIETCLKNNLIPIIGTIQFFNSSNNQNFKTVNLYVRQINAIYKNLAAQYKIYYADINQTIGRDPKLYQDYVHPSDEGYRLIAYVWFDAINKAIEDKLLLVGLNQNYPNPANTSTTIGFSLSQAGRVQIKLYNMSGRLMKNIFDAYQNAGYQQINANLTGLIPGVYVYTMQVGGQQLSKKLIIVK